MQRYGTGKSMLLSSRMWTALVAALSLLIAFGGVALAQTNPVPVQTYYVPVQEDHALDTLRGVSTNSVTPVYGRTSIAIGADGTIIYYDHWENPSNTAAEPAFDTDISNPINIWTSSNTSGTEIWGNGTCVDGAPPTINGATKPGGAAACAAYDVLESGDVIILSSTVGGAGNTSVTLANRRVIDYDGGDKFAASEQVAVSRVYWASVSNTLSAGATEVYPTNEWGTSYTSPVGQDSGLTRFNPSYLVVQAAEDGTVLTVDRNGTDAGGSYTGCPNPMKQGVSCLIPSIDQGATVVSNGKPVQVHLLSGELNSSYAYSAYTLTPDASLHNRYWGPVGGDMSSTTTEIAVFNPNTTNIRVRCEYYNNGSATSTTGSTQWVNAGTRATWTVPTSTTGEVCFTTSTTDTSSDAYNTSGLDFIAIVSVDTGAGYDWGLTMVPDSDLDKQALIGYGAGQDPNWTGAQANGSPIWVAPIANTCIYVDADGDGIMDPFSVGGSGLYNNKLRVTSHSNDSGSHAAGVPLNYLRNLAIYDGVDHDQTGMQIFSRTRDGNGQCPAGTHFDASAPGADIVLAWGERPGHIDISSPGFDVGTTVPNMRAFSVAKSYKVVDGGDIVLPGGAITYTVRLRNTGIGSLGTVKFYDDLDEANLHQPTSITFTRYNAAGVQIGVPHTITGANVAAFFTPAGYTFDTAVVFDGSPSPDLGPLGRRQYIDAVFVSEVKAEPPDQFACESTIPNSATVTIDGKPVTSTVYTPCKGQLAIVKKVLGPGGTSFSFVPSANLPGGNFNLTPAVANGTDRIDYLNLAVGAANVYQVAEATPPAGWVLTDRTCVSSAGGSGNFTTNGAAGISGWLTNINESVTCTFTNVLPMLKINIDINDVNAVGANHTHNAVVESSVDGGATWQKVNNATVNWTITGAAAATPSCNTDNDGQGDCGITFVSNTAGISGLSAKTTVSVLGISLTAETGVSANSGSTATKTWVDLSIKIDPATDTNPLNQEHTFTVTVLQNLGGATPTWVALAGAKPDVTVTPTGWTLVSENCSTTGTNASGQCTYTINSAGPNVYTAHAKVTASVSGQSMTRDTDPATADGAGPEGTNRGAEKKYVTAKISIRESATNVVGDPHTFIVKVEKHDGADWSNASGVTVSPSLVGGSVGSITGGTCQSGTTNASGECTVIVNSLVPGQTTVSASATVAVGTNPTVNVPVTTNGTGGSSVPAVKTWVDARVTIEGTATNPLNEPHTFTITAQQNLGSPDAWVAVPDGTKPVVTITPSGYTLVSDGCATTGTVNGVCTVTINSATAAVYTANAKLVNLGVSGETVVERTAPAPAVKTYVSSELIVTKTVVPSWTLEYRWDVTKTVDGPKHLFDGEEDVFNWQIVATKSISSSYDYKVSGVITVRNNGTLPVTLSKITDTVTGGVTPVVVTVDPNTCSSTTVAGNGGTVTCAYGPINVTGAADLNTAEVEVTTGETALGTRGIAWGDPTNKVNDTVDLVDTNGMTTTTSTSTVTPWTYTTDLNCETPEGFTMTGFNQNGISTGFLKNTVSVHPTGTTTTVLDSSETTGYLNCYQPSVTKTATTSLDRTHNWKISKVASTNAITLTQPATATITYEVKVEKDGFVDSNWQVAGAITLKNPHTTDAATVKVSDMLSNGVTGVIIPSATCPVVGGEITIPANGTRVCQYGADLASAAALTNTATITQTFGAVNKVYQGEAAVSFTNAAVNNINEDNVDVQDVMTSTLDSSLYDLIRDFDDLEDGETVTYPIEACKEGIYSTNGQIVTYEIENTATIVQDTTKSASEEVEITCIPFGQVQVRKTVAPTYDQHYDWEVTKTADDPLNHFDGETGVFTWTVEATRTAGLKDNHKIAGTVTISNAGPGNVVVTGISDTTDTGVAIPLNCGLGANPYPYLLAANSAINCTYPATAVPSNTQMNNVTVATSNGPVHGNAQVSFDGATVTPINATAVLSDTLLGIEETLTGSTGPVSYPQTVVNVCADNSGVTWTPGDDWTDYKREGDIVNTAVLYPSSGPQNDTTKFDDAEATQEINCYRLQTSKSADTSLVHTWDWFITKDVSQNSVDLTYPATQEITYTVSVTRSALPTPSNWKVFGNITIVNPAPLATLVDIEDVLSDNGVAFGNGDPLTCSIGAAPVTPNGSGLYAVPAGATLVCSYNEDVPAANWQSTALTNTALITQTIDGGVMRYDASDGFSFSIPPATVTKVNETSVDVKDIMTNSLGVTVPEQEWTFTDGHEEEYTHDACKDVNFGTGSTVTYKLNNTATIIQNGKSDSEEVTITCTRPDIVVVGKQFNGAYTEAYTWEITKTVEPESVDMFDGETRVLTWTITTDRSEPLFTGTQAWVIEIFNGSDRTVTVSEVDDSLGVPDCQTPFDVAAGATRTCTLTGAPFTDAQALPTDWLDNRVTITTTNGYTATAQVTGSWSGKGTVVNGSANITDTNNSEVWNGNEVITVPIEYTEDVSCESAGIVWSGDWTEGKRQGVRNNTAEVWTPGQPNVTHDSDDAVAAINCYRLGITKTVNPYFTRTYQWEIVKKADPVSVQLLDGQQAQVTWTVALTRDQGTESGFGANGVITVYNPAPMAANGVAIADLLPGVTLNCGALDVPAASGQGMGSIACPYTATLASGATVMNRATATFHNTVVTATAEVNFAGAPVTIVNPTVNVTDTNVPTTATVPWYFEGTRTETYTENLDCADVTYVNGVAQYSIPNTAQIIETKQNDKANVDVTCTALASVGDRVWRDLKPDGTTASEQWAGDGYQNWGIEPNVPGIEVQLWKPGPNGVADGTMLETTITDADGKYLFDQLTPGQYYIVFVNKSGYPALFSTMVKQGSDRTIDSDGVPAMGSGINSGYPAATTEIFTLTAGQHDPSWDQALVSTRGVGSSELGDRFWWDDNKNGVQDAGEEGVDKAKVELFKVDSLNAPVGTGTKVGEQLTDANGNYLFTGLDGGFYYVKFTLPSGVTVTERFVGSNRAVDSNIDESGYSDVVNLLEGDSNLTIDAGIFVTPTADPDDPNGEPNVGDFTIRLWLPAVTNR